MRADVRLRAHAGAVDDGRRGLVGRRSDGRRDGSTADHRPANRDRGQPGASPAHPDRGRGAVRRAGVEARSERPRALRQRQPPAPDDVSLLAQLARRRPVPGPSLALSSAALGFDSEGTDLRADRRRRSRRPPRRCPRHSEGSATGTIATAGCATRPSRLWGLHALGLDWEADDFMQFVADLERDGQRCPPDHVRARRRARPARARAHASQGLRGLGAGQDRQRRRTASTRTTCSARCSTRSTCTPRWAATSRSGCGRSSRTRSRCAIAVWREPDQGIWEARGEPKHYVSSKLMCWVALDRGARLAELEGEAELADRVAGRRRRDPRRHPRARGVRAGRVPPALRHRCARRLDAADPARRGSCRPTTSGSGHRARDRRRSCRRTASSCATGSTRPTTASPATEGTFLICSFWLVSALSEIGEADRARALCERLLAHASPLGLYAEELDARTGRHLGNYPQAFTHLALINAVIHVISQEEEAT